MLSSPTIYIQVHRGAIVAARMNGPTVRRESSALDHPRTLMGDFLVIQSLFKGVLAELKSGLVRPKVLVHLVPAAEGGYTNVEERAFLEAAHAAGARTAKVVAGGTPLSAAQVEQALQ